MLSAVLSTSRTKVTINVYHQTNQAKNDDRLSVLKKVEDKYNWDGVNFPASYEDIMHFEEQNKVSVFVYTVTGDGEIVKDKDGNGNYLENLVTLLRVENEQNAHYIYIKHLDRLLHNHHYCKDCDRKMCYSARRL